MESGTIDAFFWSGGLPTGAVAALIQDEIPKWRQVIKKAGIKTE